MAQYSIKFIFVYLTNFYCSQVALHNSTPYATQNSKLYQP